MLRTVYEWLQKMTFTRWRKQFHSADLLRWARARRRRPTLEERRPVPPKMRARLMKMKRLMSTRR